MNPGYFLRVKQSREHAPVILFSFLKLFKKHQLAQLIVLFRLSIRNRVPVVARLPSQIFVSRGDGFHIWCLSPRTVFLRGEFPAWLCFTPVSPLFRTLPNAEYTQQSAWDCNLTTTLRWLQFAGEFDTIWWVVNPIEHHIASQSHVHQKQTHFDKCIVLSACYWIVSATEIWNSGTLFFRHV